MGDALAQVLTLGGFSVGTWKGTVLCLICGCGYRTPRIYQNSKNYTPRRVFLLYAYKLINLHFIELEMHSTAGFMYHPTFSSLPPCSLSQAYCHFHTACPSRRKNVTRKIRQRSPNEKFKYILLTEALFGAETR